MSAYDSPREWIHVHEYAAKLAAVGLIALVAVGGLAWNRHKLAALQSRVAELALAETNARARADSTRHVAVTLADSLQAVQRLVVQTAAAHDSLDDALKLERKALTTATARIRTLVVTRPGTTVVRVDSVTGARSSRFVVDSTPFHVTADVVLAAPPDSGRIALAVRVDPLTLETRLGCGPSNGDGIRAASVTLVGPAWATLTLGRVEQTSDVCRSPALEPAHGDGRGLFRRLVDRVGISAGYGLVASPTGVKAGPAVLAGVKVWP